MTQIRVALKIKGKVQGVWYRKNTMLKAQSLELTGFVRNEVDGSVYAEAEGFENAVNELIDWCQKGPELAVVEEVEVNSIPPEGSEIFEIVR